MFKKAFIIMLVAEGLSLLAFVYTGLALPLLVLIGVGVFALSMKNLSWGVYILFGELFFGSRGRLLEEEIVSLRMVIFAAVLLAWLIIQIRNSKFEIRILNTKYNILYTLLLIVVAWGAIWGLVNNNGLANIFNDANGYLYLLILPVVLTVINSREQVKDLLNILAAAVVVIALKTLTLFIWFTGDLSGVATAYHWVIGSETGEITGFAGSASRIFMQSQFYSLMGLFIFSLPLIGHWFRESEYQISNIKYQYLFISAAIFGVLMSLSRSFWLGGAAAVIFVLFILLYQRVGFTRIAKFAGIIVLIATLELAGIFGLTKALGGGVSETVLSRAQNPATEAAGGARLLLLPELLTEIREAPVLGKGFGEEVTYKSFLPDRVTPQNPDGEITSFAFEWGYLDMLLKIGGLGLLIYLFWISNIFKLGWDKLRSTDHPASPKRVEAGGLLTTGLLAGLVALVALNITTPYLNHPLGIGYLIFAISYFRTVS